jgi:tetratricopeptide (TPR) repeat protein
VKSLSRHHWVLLGILAVALVVRLFHWFEIQANDPFFELPAVDGREYHAQAEAIAGGDLLGEGVTILGPLYPLFMGLVYALFGTSLAALKFLQALLGVVDCLLVFYLARLYFDRSTALLAAGATAVYGMLVFYGGTVMIVNLMVPLVLASAIAVTHAIREPTLLRWGVAGVVVAASALARQNMLFFAAAVLPWLFYVLRGRADVGQRIEFAATFAVGIALLILPFTARNLLVGDDFVLLNSTGGISVFMGNRPGAQGSWSPPNFGKLRVDSPSAMRSAFEIVAERRTGTELKPSEISSYWRGQAVEWVLEQPGDWLRLELRKLLLFVNAREIWNNRSIDISRDFSAVLRAPLLTFGVIAPLALLGMALARHRARELFPLYAMVGVFVATALLFFVLSRYRIGVVPILLIFASFAVTEIGKRIRERRSSSVAIAAGWLIVLSIFVHRDMGSENLYMAYFNLGNKYRTLERYEEAIDAYGASLEISDFIATHQNLALAYEGAGRTEDAIQSWRHVHRWSERNADVRRWERSGRHLKQLLGLPPDWKAGDPVEPR